MRYLSSTELQAELKAAERELNDLDPRALRLWEQLRIAPVEWSQNQYPNTGPVWVVALMGQRCLYRNHCEGGWGWGRFDVWGTVSEYHWEQNEIHEMIYQTLFALHHA